MEIITIIGTCPQFIKAATISRAIVKHNLTNPSRQVYERIVHTGQHFDVNMSQIFFEQMRIPKPAYDLGISNLPHGAMTGRMLEKVEDILLDAKPNLVLVYGDTNSTLAGALAASKLHIKLAHVEAGLRSFNMAMPEEINRIITDRISDLLFCPTLQSVKNLENESFNSFNCKIHQTGDVMYDAVCYYRQFASPPDVFIQNQSLLEDGFVLVTVHRAENTDDERKLSIIIESLKRIGDEMPVIFPVHPRTRQIIKNLNLKFDSKPLFFVDPVSYFEIIFLLEKSSIIMTDSGGLQKEAYFFEKPCLTLRDQTEWTELLVAGVNRLVAIDTDSIVNHFRGMKDQMLDFSGRVYGDGKAAEEILKKIIEPETVA